MISTGREIIATGPQQPVPRVWMIVTTIFSMVRPLGLEAPLSSSTFQFRLRMLPWFGDVGSPTSGELTMNDYEIL